MYACFTFHVSRFTRRSQPVPALRSVTRPLSTHRSSLLLAMLAHRHQRFMPTSRRRSGEGASAGSAGKRAGTPGRATIPNPLCASVRKKCWNPGRPPTARHLSLYMAGPCLYTGLPSVRPCTALQLKSPGSTAPAPMPCLDGLAGLWGYALQRSELPALEPVDRGGCGGGEWPECPPPIQRRTR